MQAGRRWRGGRRRRAPGASAAVAEPQAQPGLADQALERCGERGRIVGRHDQPVLAVAEQFRHAGDDRRDADQALAGGFDQHVGQAVTVAVGGDPAGKRENVGPAVALQHLLLRERALPSARASAMPSSTASALSAASASPPPTCSKRQARPRGSRASAAQQHVVAFLLDGAADAQDRSPGRPDRCRRGRCGCPRSGRTGQGRGHDS